jgi:urease accessory protein
MPRDAIPPAATWRASLALGFERRGDRSVLARREHEGPLVVQKPLYPEGDGVCHAIVVHPPGGIAAGDDLTLDVHAGGGAQALLTTPGAAKWYRSTGASARQHVSLRAEVGATLEWLPQESIVFNGARARLGWEAHLQGDAKLVAWDIVCLGRRGSGERFDAGQCELHSRLSRDGRLAWLERGTIEPGSTMMTSDAGLGGCSVFGTMVLSAPRIDPVWLTAWRQAVACEGEGAITMLPGVLIARYRGDESHAARAYFTRLWTLVREAVVGRKAVTPRIWTT